MKCLLTILFIVCSSFHCLAGVDLRQGNFYISYTDMDFPGAKADITRSYNSGNTHTGLFGYGWSSFIETKLTALPDGTICLSWWGGGLGDYYEPASINRKGLYAMIDAIIKEQLKNKKLDNNPVAIAEKRSYYLINNKQRAEKYIELQKNKIVPVYIPSPQQQKKWLLDMNQVIEWTGTLYKVKSWEDQYEFNNKGQLTLVNDRSYRMQIQYASDRLVSVTVNDSSTCRIKTDASGRIVQLSMTTATGEKTAVFQYDSLNNLLYSKDAGDNEYWFSYDLYHNLVRISYTDNSSMEMVYDGASNRIIKLKERKGNYITYQYPYFYTAEGRINYDHYATRVKQFDSTGKLSFTQYKEFESRTKDDGSTYLHRILEQTDTSYHEVLYEPEVGNARYRKKNNKEAWAAYDSKRRPSYLHINDSIYRVGYNVMGLPEYFIQKDSLTNMGTAYRYVYNEDKALSQVFRNEDVFTISDHKQENILEIQKNNGSSLAIRKMPDSSYELIADYLYSLSFSKNEWKLLSDSLLTKTSTGKPIFQKQESEEKRVEIRKKEHFATIKKLLERAKQQASQKDNKDNKKAKKESTDSAIEKPLSPEALRMKILNAYYDCIDVLKPKKIEHEWIWERM